MHSDTRVGTWVRPCGLDRPLPDGWNSLLSFKNLFFFFIFAASTVLSAKVGVTLIQMNRSAAA